MESCLQSVVSQNCPEVEHLVIDGGSTDGTVEIIKYYASQYAHIRWISEKDKGQSSAMNKGIAMAQGQILGILNVDDYYEPNVLPRILRIFGSLRPPSFLAGNCRVFKDDGSVWYINKPSHLNVSDILIGGGDNQFPHNPASYFYHKSLHDGIGLYDETDHYAMDLDFIMRALSHAHVKYVNEIWGNYRFLKGTKTYAAKENNQLQSNKMRVMDIYMKKLPLVEQWRIMAMRYVFIERRPQYFARRLKELLLPKQLIPMPVSFEHTITKSNLLLVDEVLDKAKEQGLYGLFRLNGAEGVLSELEKYHLSLFFFRVEHTFDNCPAKANFSENINQFFKKVKMFLRYNGRRLLTKARQQSKQKTPIKDLKSLNSRKILIVGWYGTETAGDKAILWAIIQNLLARAHAPEKIYLSSLYPFISQWTIKEMELPQVTVVETYSSDFEKACDHADEIIVGGGPLMDIKALDHILFAFIQAARRKKIARVEGCGIGPLRSPLFTNMVKEILRLSDHIVLRDKASLQRCQTEFLINDASTAPDPATEYVLALKARGELVNGLNASFNQENTISCFVRELTLEYFPGDYAEFIKEKKKFEEQLAMLIAYVSEKLGARAHLLAMHSFHIGGDDRSLNRRLKTKISGSTDAPLPLSPKDILSSMSRSKFNICMRFHSVVFAANLGVPYLAIDYTRGGKIQAFLEERGESWRILGLDEVAGGQWQGKLDKILEANNAYSQH